MADTLLDEAIEAATAELVDTPEAPEEPAQPEPEEPEGEVEGPEDDEIDLSTIEDDEEPEEPDDEAGDEEADEEPESDEDEGEEDADEETEDDESEVETYVVKVDGEELEVTLEDLLSGYQTNKASTERFQEASRIREEAETLQAQLQQWYEERASDPHGWVLEIAEGTQDPVGTLAGAIRRYSNPTGLIAQTIKNLVEQGALSDRFVEAFGLQEINGIATETSEQDRLSKLEQQLEEQRAQAQQQAAIQRILAEYNTQWENIKATTGLEFDTADAENQARVELMEFAKANRIGNLEVAYATKAFREGQSPQTAPQPKPTKKKTSAEAKAALDKKRKTRAVTRKPTGGPQPPKPRSETVTDAIGEAWAEVFGD